MIKEPFKIPKHCLPVDAQIVLSPGIGEPTCSRLSLRTLYAYNWPGTVLKVPPEMLPRWRPDPSKKNVSERPAVQSLVEKSWNVSAYVVESCAVDPITPEPGPSCEIRAPMLVFRLCILFRTILSRLEYCRTSTPSVLNGTAEELCTVSALLLQTDEVSLDPSASTFLGWA